MAEYIERDKAMFVILKNPPDAHYPEWYARDIREIPAADVVKVVYGEWVEEGCGLLVCSKCNFEYDHSGMPNEGLNYCPNCGAKMDGDKNG